MSKSMQNKALKEAIETDPLTWETRNFPDEETRELAFRLQAEGDEGAVTRLSQKMRIPFPKHFPYLRKFAHAGFRVGDVVREKDCEATRYYLVLGVDTGYLLTIDREEVLRETPITCNVAVTSHKDIGEELPVFLTRRRQALETLERVGGFGSGNGYPTVDEWDPRERDPLPRFLRTIPGTRNRR